MSLDIHLEIEVDTGNKPHTVELFRANITGNLVEMVKTASTERINVFESLWHPEANGIHFARQMIRPLEIAIIRLKAEPERYRKLNPLNGWGTYDILVSTLVAYLTACVDYPKAKVWTG